MRRICRCSWSMWPTVSGLTAIRETQTTRPGPESRLSWLQSRGYKYVEETIQMLPEKPEPVLLAKILNQVAGLGRIHAAEPSFSFS